VGVKVGFGLGEFMRIGRRVHVDVLMGLALVSVFVGMDPGFKRAMDSQMPMQTRVTPTRRSDQVKTEEDMRVSRKK
jgi:hypothetical protein